MERHCYRHGLPGEAYWYGGRYPVPSRAWCCSASRLRPVLGLHIAMELARLFGSYFTGNLNVLVFGECGREFAYRSLQVSKVDPVLDKADTSYTPRNEKDVYNHSLCMSLQYTCLTRMVLTCADTPEKYADAPVSLQLVVRRYEEEKLLAITEFLQRLL